MKNFMVVLKSKWQLILFILLLFVIYGLSTGVRISQIHNIWDKHSDIYYYDDIPLSTTLDAYKWTRYAKEWDNNEYSTKEKDPLMYYPDGNWRPDPVPLFSVLIAYTANIFNINYYKAGLYLVSFFAGLFIFPIGILFYKMKLPYVGLIAGFCGTFGYVYYSRSNPGRIDTDCLILFFLTMISLMIYMAVTSKSLKLSILFSFLAGISQFFFCWWYEHPLFIIVNGFFLALLLLINKYSIKNIIFLCLIFALASGPNFLWWSFINLLDLFSVYIGKDNHNIVGFPNVFATISEFSSNQIFLVIENSFINTFFFTLAAVGLALFIYRNYKAGLSLAPLIALGFMPFISSSRFIMYLTPTLGLGIGYFVYLSLSFARKISEDTQLIIGYSISIIFALSIYVFNLNGFNFRYVGAPSINANIYSFIDNVGRIVPEKSAIFSWWDYGLAIEDQTGIATFHDGMTQSTEKTYMIARSFTNSLDYMTNNISFTLHHNPDQMDYMVETIGLEEFDKLVNNYNKKINNDTNNVYILFTADMIEKFTAIQYIGNWDIINNKKGYIGGINFLPCRYESRSNSICGSLNINFLTGIVNGKIPLENITYVDYNNGKQYKTYNTNYASDYYLVALKLPEEETVHAVYLMQKNDYYSAFTQLYLLGNYDPEYFQEVLLAYPVGRLFKLLKVKEQEN